MGKELWRNIDGYKGLYQISSMGNIRSFKYNKPRILKARMNSKGYNYVNLCINGKFKSICNHRLVAKYFLDKNKFNKYEVNHIDGNKNNNSLENLEYVTRLENMKHALKNKLLKNLKIDFTKADEIRYKYKNGSKLESLCKEYNLSKSNIYRIINNKIWKQ
jgi:hypothetical protein